MGSDVSHIGTKYANIIWKINTHRGNASIYTSKYIAEHSYMN